MNNVFEKFQAQLAKWQAGSRKRPTRRRPRKPLFHITEQELMAELHYGREDRKTPIGELN